MSLPLNERLKLSSEAMRLLRVLRGENLPLFSRAKASRERLEILKKLKGVGATSPTPDRMETKLETVATAGRDFLASVDAKIPEDAREQIVNDIKGNERIKAIFAAQKWSEKGKAEIMEKICSEPKAYDVWRIVKADIDTTRGETNRHGIYEAVLDIHNEHYERLGRELMPAFKKLVDASPMTEEEALKRAQSCEIDRLAQGRLSRQKKGDFRGKGADAQLLQATADLFKLINYRNEPLKFSVVDSRAHYDHTRKLVNIGDSLTYKTLWHEVSHSIEYEHPEVLEMSKNFLRERLKKSNGIRSLRDIYSNKWGNSRKLNYSRSETAIDDGAFDPYVTKFYGTDPHDIDTSTATEVLTMGVQSFASVIDLGRMAAADPEHLEFIIGVIRHLQQKQHGADHDQA